MSQIINSICTIQISRRLGVRNCQSNGRIAVDAQSASRWVRSPLTYFLRRLKHEKDASRRRHHDKEWHQNPVHGLLDLLYCQLLQPNLTTTTVAATTNTTIGWHDRSRTISISNLRLLLTVRKNVNVKRGLFVGDVTMLARINQVSNGRLWYFAHMIALNFPKRW